MDFTPFHPLDEPDFKELQPAAIEEAVDELRHATFFHTLDVVRHTRVQEAHRWHGYSMDFTELVEAWLRRKAFSLGVRGPLPGHPELGARWAFYSGQASPVT